MKAIKLLVLAGALIAASTQMADSAETKHSAASSKTTANGKTEKAYFAAGCFWKVQYVFGKVPGVVKTRVGYTGGNMPNPSYKQVCSDTTGHAEAVQVEFDPTKVSYKKLLQVFWGNHDPTTPNRQGPDFGSQYRSVVFYANDEQKKEAIEYKDELEKAHKFRSKIVTAIQEAGPFYDAEEYHQDYFIKHGQSCE